MLKVKFNLREQMSLSETLINLIVNHNNVRYKISTGRSVNPKYWNTKAQRCKELMDFREGVEINQKLDLFESVSKKIIRKADDDCIELTNEQFRRQLGEATENPNRFLNGSNFWDYFDDFVAYKKPRVSNDVIKDYNNSLRKHLTTCESRNNSPLSFGALKNQTNGFTDRLEYYLTYEAINKNGGRGLRTNTVGKQFKNLKSFLHWCFEKGIYPSFSLKHMVTKTEEVDTVFLTEEEITRLIKLKLTDDLETKVRDLFIIACETALRFTDFNRLNEYHFVDDDTRIRPTKRSGNRKKSSVNRKLIIPNSPRLRRILDKYQNNPPSVSDTTEFNKTIRAICEKAKINQLVTCVKERGNTSFEETKMKFKLVSSHTGRRSFCTNKFLGGMPVQAIMKFSGHKTESSFMRYLRIDNELAATKYREFFK